MASSSKSKIRPDFTPNTGEQWQVQCSNINQAFAHLFLNPLGADIYFVPLMNAENPPRRFPAHKVVLLARSPVFSAQFHYDKEKTSSTNGVAVKSSSSLRKRRKKEPPKNVIPEVQLPDIEPDAFEQFLRFCYTDKAEFTGENAASIFYTANFYYVPKLAEQAMRFICDQVKVENAFEMLQFAHEFGYGEIAESVLEVIASTTMEAIKADAFLDLDHGALELFVKRNFLAISEIDLFKWVIRWAKKRQTIAENQGKALRELLGPALYYIQFWQMTLKDFLYFVVPANVLTKTETVFIYDLLHKENRYDVYSRPELSFPSFKRRDRLLTLDITNVEELEPGDEPLCSDPIYIEGFEFRMEASVRADPKNAEKEYLSVYFNCCVSACFATGSNWSYDATVELTLINKQDSEENLGNKFSWTIKRDRDGVFCGYRKLIALDELLDRENGWIDENDHTLTLKALVVNIDKKEEEEDVEDED